MSHSDSAEGSSPSEEKLLEEIEHTRTELGNTVEALAARADMKARAQDATAAARRQLREAAGVAANQARVQLVEAAGTASVAAARARRRLRGRAEVLGTRIDATVPAPVRRIQPSSWLLGGAFALAVVAVLRWRRR